MGGCLQKMAAMEGKTVYRILAAINIVVSLVVIVVSIFSMINVFAPSSAILSFFCALFSLIFIIFYIPFPMITRWMLRNFGFLYTSFGRFGFLIFLAFLSLNLNANYAITIVWGLLAFLNVFILYNNKEFRRVLAEEEQVLKGELRGQSPVRPAVPIGAVKPARPATTGASDVWEEVIDPESGNKYYFNSKTNETSWDPPATR